jgi:hypothetical protein
VIPDAPGRRDWFDRSVRSYGHIERIGGIMQGTLTMRRRSRVVIAAGVTAAGALWSTHTGAPARPETAAAAPGWRVALDARSAALNQRYGLGGATQDPAATSTPTWYTALTMRSAALDRRYGLGVYAKPTATAPEWFTALMVRSAALNRRYAITGPPCVVTCEVRHG